METATNREGNMTTSTDTWDTTTQAGRDAVADAAQDFMATMNADALHAWLVGLLDDWNAQQVAA